MSNNTLTTIHPKSSLDSYLVVRGISEGDIAKLIQYARVDQDVKTHTSDYLNADGSPGRFNSLESYRTWEKKGRIIYSLLDKDNEFVGIIWFSHEPQTFDNVTYDFTFGIRLYGKARGIGLAKPFYKAVLVDLLSSREYQESQNKGIWLRTSADNIRAVQTYKSLGYTEINHDQPAHKITMVLQ
ncbi:GNAT family N-acetyltransferase [Candidatus Woesebacteria bacterium]|nr:GNAT family N-acetyltransferase [Candidatus Woesebacteria bacterium]